MLVTDPSGRKPITTENHAKTAAKSAAAALSSEPDSFAQRHIGPGRAETRQMLDLLGYASLEALVDAAVPEQIRLRLPLRLPEARSEAEVLAALREAAGQNQIYRSITHAKF